MRVQEVMTPSPHSCAPDDSLATAAHMMFERDVGCVPVIDHEGRVISMITDRDICIAALTQGKPLHEMVVSSACARRAHVVHQSDTVENAEAIMAERQVRRLPVIDDEEKLVGILSMNDLARATRQTSRTTNGGLSKDGVARTLAAISEHTQPAGAMV